MCLKMILDKITNKITNTSLLFRTTSVLELNFPKIDKNLWDIYLAVESIQPCWYQQIFFLIMHKVDGCRVKDIKPWHTD